MYHFILISVKINEPCINCKGCILSLIFILHGHTCSFECFSIVCFDNLSVKPLLTIITHRCPVEENGKE